MNEVLFICSGNYYRSRFAEILFNHLAAREGVDWTAVSRGFRLSPNNVGPISKYTAAACLEQGLDYDRNRWPIVLDESDLCSASRIIALKEAEHRSMMHERFPEWENKIEYWRIDDIDAAAPDVALVQLAQEVRQLFSSLRA